VLWVEFDVDDIVGATNGVYVTGSRYTLDVGFDGMRDTLQFVCTPVFVLSP